LLRSRETRNQKDRDTKTQGLIAFSYGHTGREGAGGLVFNLRDRDRHGDGVDPQGNGDGRDPLGWDDTLGADGFLPF